MQLHTPPPLSRFTSTHTLVDPSSTSIAPLARHTCLDHSPLTCFTVSASRAGPSRCLLANTQHSHTPPSCTHRSSQKHGPHAHLIFWPRPMDRLLAFESSFKFESKLSRHKARTSAHTPGWGKIQTPAASTRHRGSSGPCGVPHFFHSHSSPQ